LHGGRERQEGIAEKDLSALFASSAEGDIRSLARLITLVENESPLVPEIYRIMHPLRGQAHIVGIYGPPGSGKSTLINGLIALLRERDLRIGVIAIDPTSPYSGGALLGDRIRMQRHSIDDMVMIRSMATRGQMGGLSLATRGAVGLLDAAGMDVIIVETVGVGQAEVDIADAADTAILVTMPGQGDQIQVFKAGIMEIGDIFVVNKADQGGAEKVMLEIQYMLGLNRDLHDDQDWLPPVIRAEAINEKGVEELALAMDDHRSFLRANGGLEEKRKRILVQETMEIISSRIKDWVIGELLDGGSTDDLADRICELSMDPYAAAMRILEKIDMPH
jgi:LAO/AO transport system kinase